MIQNLIALTIVFFAVGYTIVSVIRNLTAKKSTKCGGCSDCSFHESSIAKPVEIKANNNGLQKLMLRKHGK